MTQVETSQKNGTNSIVGASRLLVYQFMRHASFSISIFLLVQIMPAMDMTEALVTDLKTLEEGIYVYDAF